MSTLPIQELKWPNIVGYLLVFGSLYLYIVLPGYMHTFDAIILSVAFIAGVYLSRSKDKEVVGFKCFGTSCYLFFLADELTQRSLYTEIKPLLAIMACILFFISFWIWNPDYGGIYLDIRKRKSIRDAIKLYRVRRREIKNENLARSKEYKEVKRRDHQIKDLKSTIEGEWVTEKHGIVTEELVFLNDGTFASVTGVDRNVQRGKYEVINDSQIKFNDGAFLGQIKFIKKHSILISIGDNDQIMNRKK